MEKVNPEWGTVKVLYFHDIVDGVDNHTGGCDQRETKNHVHTHLGSGSNNKGWLAPIFHRVGQVELEHHSEISCDGPRIILDNTQQNDGRIIFGKEDLGNAVGVQLCNSREKVIVSCAERCRGINDTSDARAVAAIQVGAKLESNVGHHALDGNWEDWAMNLCLQNLGIIKEDDGFAVAMSMTSTSRSSRSGTSNTSDQGAHTGSISGDLDRLKDLLLNMLLAFIIKVGIVGGGKILALLTLLLLFLTFGLDTIDGPPGISGNSNITGLRTLDDIDTVL